MAEMDVHPEKVRRLTGHSNIRVLLDHYIVLEVGWIRGRKRYSFPTLNPNLPKPSAR
jgi:hypothetical protein